MKCWICLLMMIGVCVSVTAQNDGVEQKEYVSMAEAEAAANSRIDRDMAHHTDVLDERDIRVVFDGVPTLAYRVVYRDYPSEELAVTSIYYYIAEAVKGRYISCTLWHNAKHRNDYDLPPTLQKLMSIPELPPDASVFPEEDVEYDYEDEETSPVNMFEIQAGAMLPVGRLSNAFNVAPSFGFFFGYPLNNRMKIDVGMQLAVPVNPRYFAYHDHQGIYDAKSRVILGMSARYNYLHRIDRQTVLSLYTGLGVSGILTDLEKDPYNDEYSEYYSCETLDLLGGVSLRRKVFGVFAEYHFLPYSISGKVKSGFGNSALNLGLVFGF